MTKRDIAELACRILALYYLVTNLHSFASIPLLSAGLRNAERVGNFTHTALLLGSALGILFVLGAVWFLWTRSRWIATKMVPDDSDDPRWPHVRVADLQVAAFSTIGLMALMNGVPAFCRSAGHYFSYLYENHQGLSFFDWLLLEQTLPSLLSIAIGLCLFLGSRGIVRLVRRLQRPVPGEVDEGPIPAESEAAKGASV